jgi:hypothetical protein
LIALTSDWPPAGQGIGLGGHHIGRQKEEKVSIEIIRAAIQPEYLSGSRRRMASTELPEILIGWEPQTTDLRNGPPPARRIHNSTRP